MSYAYGCLGCCHAVHHNLPGTELQPQWPKVMQAPICMPKPRQLASLARLRPLCFWTAQVKIKDRLLIISGTRVLADTFPDFTGQRQMLGQERQHGDFIRAVQLPADACVKPGSIHAKVVEGVLEVTVDKAWGSRAPDIDEIKIQF